MAPPSAKAAGSSLGWPSASIRDVDGSRPPSLAVRSIIRLVVCDVAVSNRMECGSAGMPAAKGLVE